MFSRQMRTLRDDSILEDARRQKAMQPITWRDVRAMASIPALYGGTGLLLISGPRFAAWHTWPVFLCLFFTLGGACLTWATYRAMQRGWTHGHIDPFVKVGCWFFFGPLVAALLVSVGECATSL
jgi:hypothetical protein